ncbi:MAG: 16S rRNA (cytidine(1402)-2'-O)-methyltransferase [Peptoanaerobacter stomatis]|uniref:16S rRNA (cytidine(1402)-2'-O)-methyltransferase n=1 Tax=Peptoanaerobacter stomatis TaxID=796937 RepID=UPI003FA06EBE
MLYICPTPIGNLEDITIRTLNTLRFADEIYCEDTRHTIKLLNHYEIKKPLFSLHEHNENMKSDEVIEKIKSGKNIAYVSDAGMPGISDPGSKLIQLCIENGVQVTTLPGASAMVVALVNSGLDTRSFTFVGFLERENGKKKAQLEKLLKKKETLIIYESPHRIKQTVKQLYEVFLNRKTVIAREISKKFEEYIRTDLQTLDYMLNYEKKELIGELILIIEGNKDIKQEQVLSDDEIISILKEKTDSGLSTKDAVKFVSKEYNINKNRVYNISTSLSE